MLIPFNEMRKKMFEEGMMLNVIIHFYITLFIFLGKW